MTNEEFSAKYRLLKALGEGPGRTYSAEHRSSGRMAMVHFLDEATAAREAEVMGLVERLPPADRSKVLDVLTVDRSLVVITQFIPGVEDFEQWLRSADPSETPPSPPSQPSVPAAGDFTAMFLSGKDPAAVARPPAPPPVAPRAPAGPSFTELFRAPPETPTLEPMPAEPRAAAAPPPVRVVGVRLPTPPKPLAAKPPELPIPMPNLGAAPPHPVAPRSLEPPVPREAALFTPEVPPPPPVPQPWSGPSDYTRELSPGAQFSEPVPVMAPPLDPPPAPEQRKRSYLPLLLVLNLVFIIATGLAVYFALRAC